MRAVAGSAGGGEFVAAFGGASVEAFGLLRGGVGMAGGAIDFREFVLVRELLGIYRGVAVGAFEGGVRGGAEAGGVEGGRDTGLALAAGAALLMAGDAFFRPRKSLRLLGDASDRREQGE